MRKDQIEKMPLFFDRYINKVPNDLDLLTALEEFRMVNVLKDDLESLSAKADYAYDEGKWTVKQLLQHCLDTERILAYRLLSIARGEKKDMIGFDENMYAENANVENKSIQALLGESEVLRTSSIYLVNGLSAGNLQNVGRANSVEISALALGYTIVGHVLHHYQVLKEKYLL
jgi:hypothetical protein